MAQDWKDPDIAAQLKKLWDEGHSASAIARMMGGVTRNAVIGAVRRADLPYRAPGRDYSAIRRHGPRKPPKAAERSKPISPARAIIADGLPLPPPAETDIARISFDELEAHHCRFVTLAVPAGPFVKQFCGATVVPGLSYCPAHIARCLNLEKPLRSITVHRRQLQVA